jgi:hypothetical protein
MDNFSKAAIPGEWYWLSQDFYQTGLLIHLATILPCSILVVLQFIPAFRDKLIVLHRINGYIIILLFLISNVGILMIAPRTFGGDLHVQFAIALLIVMITASILIAIIYIRRKQIEEHRAWMLRGMFYMGGVVTIRPLMAILILIFSRLQYAPYVVWPCAQIEFTWNFYEMPFSYLQAYPLCNATTALTGNIIITDGEELVHIVHADPRAENPISLGASVQLAFGLSIWIAMVIHVVGIELYLRLAPREHERLRAVSNKRQAAKRHKEPGSAGRVVQKLGDADVLVPPAA